VQLTQTWLTTDVDHVNVDTLHGFPYKLPAVLESWTKSRAAWIGHDPNSKSCSAAFLAPNVAIRHGVRVLREPGRVPILAAAYGPSKQCAHLAVVRSHAVLRNRLRLAVMEARATRQAEGITPLRAPAQRR